MPLMSRVRPVLNGGTDAVFFCFLWLYLSAGGPGPWSIEASINLPVNWNVKWQFLVGEGRVMTRGHDYVTVYLRASLIDYTTDEQSPVMDGSASR